MGRQTLAKRPRCYLSISGLLFGTLLISGCGLGSAGPYPARQAVVPKIEIIDVENGSISVMPPPGFCKDAAGSKNTETSTFLIFANCGYLNSNGKRPSPNAQFSGLLTTSIAKTATLQDNGGVDAVADFLSSDEGLEALSASGDAKTVSVKDKRRSDDGVYLHFQDTDAALSQNVWKSFLNRSDHLVTVTLLQSKNTSLTPEQAMQFLQSYSETIKLSTEPAGQMQPNTSPTPPVAYKKQLKKVGILRRLFL